jgi:hypothetical protein
MSQFQSSRTTLSRVPSLHQRVSQQISNYPHYSDEADEEYHVDYDEDEPPNVESKVLKVHFLMPKTGSLQVTCPGAVALAQSHYTKLLLQQHIFELDFKVENLRAVISKSGKGGSDRLVGDLHLEGFFLTFAMTDFVMKVDLKLKVRFSPSRFFNVT